ncbi:calcineurin-like phosphoesterase family protein [Nonlabens dokdonensis]|jgi:hypothetical protein|uniref:Metallophosphoesterase n=2 Tax=Nonlabens dokdonensis TaxID=328515 RepID=L7WCD0_NONDD|nr:metallophosphoesterase [Nonlabens dokdonensis]AGC77857.1 metallophosphoesterase [Nonlabens dokdonensis DSW-6]PZX39613.1 calcineurin-like phosphoesterase family protein [Nonlabens dokdonensis]
MKSTNLLISFVFIILLTSCKKEIKEKPIIETEEEIVVDTPIFSFSFTGCNRIDRGDQSTANPSTANTYVLKRVLFEIAQKEEQPELFFFLGDLVLAESTNAKLNSQLSAWDAIYKEQEISNSGIEMVAIPGNHEMLYSVEVSENDWHEFPLKGSTDIWLQHMKDYLPDGRVTAPDTLGLDNRLSFSFTRHNVGFVVLNSDTYNPPSKTDIYGKEGQIPVKWVNDQVTSFKNNPSIEHIFVVTHRPYYVDGNPDTSHGGLPQGPDVWPTFEENKVVALLSAHKHDYQRVQPINEKLGGGTYQVIAGNGGSSGEAAFFGYSTITVMKSGNLVLNSVGFDKGMPYTASVPNNPTTSRDSIVLTWEENPSKYYSLTQSKKN